MPQLKNGQLRKRSFEHAKTGLRSAKALNNPRLGYFPDFKGRGGARPGAGRKKSGQVKKKLGRPRTRASKPAPDSEPAPAPRSGLRRSRLRPRGPLTDSEIQECHDNRLYKELVDSRQLQASQAEVILALQVCSSPPDCYVYASQLPIAVLSTHSCEHVTANMLAITEARCFLLFTG